MELKSIDNSKSQKDKGVRRWTVLNLTNMVMVYIKIELGETAIMYDYV